MFAQYADTVDRAMEASEKRVLRLFALVGLAALNWNSVEEMLERLIWYYIGPDDIGHIITAKLHNVSRCEVLTNLVDAREAHADIRARVIHFVKAFDTLRVNRNTLIHSVRFSLNHGEGELSLERLKKSVRTREYDTLNMPVATLERLANQIADLNTFGETLLAIMKARSGLIKQSFYNWPQPPPWPKIFPLPERLS
jgi:hypothetical protein